MRFVRQAFLLLLLVVAGCAPLGPPFASVANTLPPIPPGSARIFVYRLLEPYESLSFSTAYLNGDPVGVTQPGAVLYRDVAPGQYTISVQSYGTFPNQFKTVVVAAGQIAYARIGSLRSWSSCQMQSNCQDTFVVTLVDRGTALNELASLRLIAG